ncbi:endonuclease/exonuclease/phosphatase family protein [Streptomyces sp. NPDC026672]|uniref:endonuclease/exonuclease/phosphatase family protein n=1 Tax=unclassified Streptomyces TaxID=2593676 RepID=UPI0033F66EFC
MAINTDELCVASWNVAHNGRRLDSKDSRRRPAHSVLARFVPHVVFRHELTGASANSRAELYEEANKLALLPFMPETKPGRSRNPPGIMIDPHLFEVVAQTDHDLPWKPVCHVRVRLKGCPKPLELASAHLTHFDPTMRATEARRLTVLADHGRTALIGLDANSYPHRSADETTDPLVWNAVDDPVHFQQRTIERHGRRVSDTRPSEILTGGRLPVFTDLAHHAGTTLHQAGAMEATASLTRTDQGPPQRIDWIIATPDLTPALRSVEVVATEEVRLRTDHGLLIARFSLSDICDILMS